MPTISRVEADVFRLEGFEVRIRHLRDGRDVRSDRRISSSYGYRHRAPADTLVATYLANRFKDFSGFEVEVIYPDGKKVNGRTKLSTVRARYGT